MSVTMARPQPLDWKYEIVGRRYRVGEEHPEFKGWYFSGQYTREGRALWSRPPGGRDRWLQFAGFVVLWLAGVLLVTMLCSWLFGGVVPVLMEPR